MARFVLVHGSWHGAWCWEALIPELAAAGHAVTAVDLPGHGDDRAPLAGRTLGAYVDRVVAAIEAAPGSVILVGHSMGGVVVTQTAERVPERIARLVYVAAFLPAEGQSLLDLAKTDAESAILPALVFDEPGGVHWVQPEARVGVFYGECERELAERSAARFVDEPLAPVATPVHVTAERYGRVPRAYVRAERDRCLTPALQTRMLAVTPCATVLSLDSDHSPFFSRTAQLAEALVALSGQHRCP